MKMWLLLLAIPFFALAQERQDENDKLEIQIEQSKQQIYCWNMICRLELTSEQAKKLLELAKEIEPLIKHYRKEQALNLISMERVLIRFHEEVERDKLSEETEKQARFLEHRGKEMKLEFLVRVNEFESRARAVLTSRQLILAENYRPRLSNEKEGRQNGDIAAYLLKIRDMPEETFKRKAPRKIRRYLKKLAKKHEKVDLPSEKDLMHLLLLTRELPEMEFQENFDVILEQFSPKTRVREARKQLQRIRRETHGHMSDIGKYLLSPYCIPFYRKIAKKE